MWFFSKWKSSLLWKFGPLRAILFPDGATHAWSVVPCPILIQWYVKAVYPRKLLTCSGRVAGHQCEPLYYSVCMIACVVFQASLRLCEFFEMRRNCVADGCTRNSKTFSCLNFPKIQPLVGNGCALSTRQGRTSSWASGHEFVGHTSMRTRRMLHREWSNP